MSSFRRIKPSSAPPPPPGTILFPSVSLPHISTGLASLDDVLAPGQPLSSALLILTPDAHSAWGKLMQRYWISQGLLGGQGVVVVGGEGEGEELVEGAMWEAKKPGGGAEGAQAKAEESASDGEGLEEEEEAGKKKIAWRYGGMGKFKTTVDSSSSSANSFNYTLSLTHHIPKSTLAALKSSGQLAYVVARPTRKGKGKQVDGSELDRVLLELKTIIEEGDYNYASTSKQPARALRIALPNLFSTSYGDVSMTQMYRFLHSLRAILRSSRTAAMITLPAHLCQKSELRERLMWGTDAVVELEGFGSDPTLPLLFPSHHGLLHLHAPFHLSSLAPPSQKLSTLVGGRGGQNNLAFKLKRKAFVVETLHLDVEGGVGERRTTAPVALGEDLHAGHGHDGHEHGETKEVQIVEGGRVRIEVAEEEAGAKEETKREVKLPRKSAMKKSVGFAVVDPTKPELYEFYDNVGRGECAVVDTYWQTETGSIVITPLPGAIPTKPGSATFPFAGIEAKILDPTTGAELLGNDVEGVLVISKPWPSIARTVYKDHARFIETYLKPYPGYYFTGDGAGRDKDGYIWIKGRVDDVINVSGHRLSTAEIESALIVHAGVAETAVVGTADDLTGQAVYAFVAMKPEFDFKAHKEADLLKELTLQVRKVIGPFAAPKGIFLVPDLPKTRSGKIMRRILRKIVAGEGDQLGDLSTLADPSVVDAIKEKVGKR